MQLLDGCLELIVHIGFNAVKNICNYNGEVSNIVISEDLLKTNQFHKLEWLQWIMV